MIVWIDIETTGLDPHEDAILEVAMIVTADDLTPIAKYSNIIKPSEDKLLRMDDYVTKMHTGSGLLDELAKTDNLLGDIENELITVLEDNRVEKRALLAGNSVHFDRNFLEAQMPELMKRFSYQNLDVTSVSHVVRRFLPAKYEAINAKRGEIAHRAMDDIESSIEQLRKYLSAMGITDNYGDYPDKLPNYAY
jgi:oligoribonuclease